MRRNATAKSIARPIASDAARGSDTFIGAHAASQARLAQIAVNDCARRIGVSARGLAENMRHERRAGAERGQVVARRIQHERMEVRAAFTLVA